MKRSLKLALIPTAIAAALSANQAFAGTEACFEVYNAPVDDGLVTAHQTLYTLASCVAEGSRGTAGANQLQATSEMSIAYELTKDLDVNLEDINGDATADDELHIVYIPTTDLPSGSRVVMQLSGAVWANNANQLHLVRVDNNNTEGDDTDDVYELVASSDGAFDGTSEVEFLTRAGVTIGAGTRLALTTSNAIDGEATPDAPAQANAGSGLILSPNFTIANTACPTTGSVTISATSARTDGGSTIAGGQSSSAQLVADISQQFVMFDNHTDNAVGPNQLFSTGSASLVVEQVDAEETNGDEARTRFVNTGAGDFVVTNVTRDQVLYPFVMVDRGPSLDRAVTITAADDVNISVVASDDPGATIVSGLYNTWLGGENAPTAAVDLNGAGTAGNTIAPSLAGTTPAVVSLPGDTVFADGAAGGADAGSYYTPVGLVNDNAWVLSLENSDTDETINFNYTVDVQYSLDFDNANLIDHCQLTENAFQIGVNGAVLKVPYTYDANTNWVRITNEHTDTAVVTLDVFDESGNVQNSVEVGTIGAKSSNVYLANELLDLAAAAGYMGTGTRHTMTFTVTAPSNSVHGVSVQKIPGGVDRVLPVLDQNDWRQ